MKKRQLCKYNGFFSRLARVNNFKKICKYSVPNNKTVATKKKSSIHFSIIVRKKHIQYVGNNKNYISITQLSNRCYQLYCVNVCKEMELYSLQLLCRSFDYYICDINFGVLFRKCNRTKKNLFSLPRCVYTNLTSNVPIGSGLKLTRTFPYHLSTNCNVPMRKEIHIFSSDVYEYIFFIFYGYQQGIKEEIFLFSTNILLLLT